MELALAEARRGLAVGEVPIGAVLVSGGIVIARGFNQPLSTTDPTAHAEIVALRAASQRVGNYRLPGAILYVTLEPCLMCVGALVHARVATVVYGAPEPRTGAMGSALDALPLATLNHRFDIVSGVLEEECRELVQEFFRAKR